MIYCAGADRMDSSSGTLMTTLIHLSFDQLTFLSCASSRFGKLFRLPRRSEQQVLVHWLKMTTRDGQTAGLTALSDGLMEAAAGAVSSGPYQDVVLQWEAST